MNGPEGKREKKKDWEESSDNDFAHTHFLMMFLNGPFFKHELVTIELNVA